MFSKNKQGNKRQLFEEKVQDFTWSQVVYQKQHAVDIKINSVSLCYELYELDTFSNRSKRLGQG